MASFSGRGILVELAAMTAPPDLVSETLLPYARGQLTSFLRRRWADSAVTRAREQIAQDANGSSFQDWLAPTGRPPEIVFATFRAELERLLSTRCESAGLRSLLTAIWSDGLASGRLQPAVREGVAPALRAWQAAGRGIWTIGALAAAVQRLFFQRTEEGSLARLFRGHIDRHTIARRAAAGFLDVATAMELPPAAILYLGTKRTSLDAASAAGLATAIVERDGSGARDSGHRVLHDLRELVLS
jgi:enolase-phosphatase E1